ncbi:MAG: tetratricopeptide repeat protein [Jatrophihabitantaceae bacterium]
MTENEAVLAADRHVWLTGELQAHRLAAYAGLALAPPLVPGPLNAHRNLRGPYTAAGALLTMLVPEVLASYPDLVTRHEIEILTAAPALTGTVPPTLSTLTSLAVPEERTRFYSGVRTLRIAHGLAEFLRSYLRESGIGVRSVFFDDLHRADRTDQELLAVLLRRIDPRLLTIVVGSAAEIEHADSGQRQLVSDLRPAAGGLPAALPSYCNRIEATPIDGPTRSPAGDAELARAYVWSDGTAEEPDLQAGYLRVAEAERRLLHDQRADELLDRADSALAWGPIPFHRIRGRQPFVDGARALNLALNECMMLGFYDATIEMCEYGRSLVSWDSDPDLRWLFTTKLPTSLSAIGRGEDAQRICQEGRANTVRPLIHRQLAYATSMLYIRHLEPHQHDVEKALGWINVAISLASLFEDPKEREFGVVFNQNGRALIEMRRGRADVALDLVTSGMARLDDFLQPGEHLLHRSVLQYNRAQVLASMGRVDEALADYRSVIELDPHYPEYHLDVGNLLHRMGRDDEALAEYETAMQLGPPIPELYYNRADVLVGIGKLEEALQDFSYVLELQPDHLDALLNRAGILADLGASEAADRDITAGLGIDPVNVHLLCLRGRLRLEAGEHAAARRVLSAAVQADPGLASAWALRGAVDFAVQDFEGAGANLDTAVTLDPHDAAILFNRGSVHQALGRWQAAAADFARVGELDPADADAPAQHAICVVRLAEDASASL